MLLSSRISLLFRSFFNLREAPFTTFIGRQTHITNIFQRVVGFLSLSRTNLVQIMIKIKKKKKKKIKPSDKDEKTAQAKETLEEVGNKISAISHEANLNEVQFQEGFRKDGNPDSFKELVQSRFYVDKSLFIEDFIGDVKCIIITRPRRFGKSMVIQMIQNYFNPKDTTRKTQINNKQISDISDINQGVFKNLKIVKAKIDHSQYYHKYPCIYFEFQGVIVEDGDMYGSLRNSIENAFRRFRFIYDDYYKRQQSNGLSNYDLNHMINFEIYMDAKKQKIKLDYIISSLNFLVDQVSDYYESPVILLIDEYDILINTAFIEMEEKDFKQLCYVYSEMIKTATKGKNNVFKALMIGIMNFAKSVTFSGLNHFYVYPIDNYSYSQYFGFSQQELDDICSKILNEEKSNKDQFKYFKYLLKYWYNGYQMSNNLMYNPFSIVYCLTNFFQNRNRKCFQPYWNNSGKPDVIIHYLMQLEDITLIQNLLAFKDLYYGDLNEDLQFYSIHKNEEQVIKLMFDQGYLTSTNKEGGYYKLPNNETKISLIEQFLTILLKQETNDLVSTITIKQLAKNVANKEDFQKLVQEKILNKLSNEDKNESFFQALLFGISMISILNRTKNILHPQIEVTQDFDKRIDSIFLPNIGEKNAPQVGIVQEYKICEQGKDDNYLINVLWQILATGYLNHLLGIYQKEKNVQKWESIIVRAIVFYRVTKINTENNENRLGWTMKIDEFVFSIEEATKVNNLFTSSINQIELLTNHEDLVNKKEARVSFFKKIEQQNTDLKEISIQNLLNRLQADFKKTSEQKMKRIE